MEEEEEMPEAGPSTIKPPSAGPSGEGEADAEPEAEEEEEQEILLPQPPPKIMITTSPSPCKLTYQFCDELKNVFPGGEFFKRPRGKGFELGRLARWGIKRGFGAVIVVNEDHKAPSTFLSFNSIMNPVVGRSISSRPHLSLNSRIRQDGADDQTP
jgi:ribosome production factor 1